MYPDVPSNAAVPVAVIVAIALAPAPVTVSTAIVTSLAGVAPPKLVPRIVSDCPTP